MQTMLHAIPPPSWTQFKKSELFSRVRCCNKVVSDAHFIVPPSSPATLKPEGESTRSDDGTHHFGTRFSSRLLNGRVMRRKEILAGAAAAEIYYVGGSAPIFPGSLAGVPALEHKLRWCMTSAHARLGRSAITSPSFISTANTHGVRNWRRAALQGLRAGGSAMSGSIGKHAGVPAGRARRQVQQL